MRYEGQAKYETINELLQVMYQKWIEYQGFKMEIIDDQRSIRNIRNIINSINNIIDGK